MRDRVIGVDVGGTKVSVAVLEGSTLREPRILATDTSDAPHLLDQLVDAIVEAGPANAVGVAVPSVVDFASGRVRASVNVPLADVALRDILRERIGVPVVVDNDATCAALAEAYDDDGALVGRHLVMFTIGTGVGAGIVIDGRVYRGATGAAAELGHTIVGADLSLTPFAYAEGFPQLGSVELLASGTALNALAHAYGIPGHGRRCSARRPPRRGCGVGAAGTAHGRRDRQRNQHLRPRPRCHRRRRLLRRRAAARSRARGGSAPRADRRRHETQICRARYGSQAGARGAVLLATQEAARAHEVGVR